MKLDQRGMANVGLALVDAGLAEEPLPLEHEPHYERDAQVVAIMEKVKKLEAALEKRGLFIQKDDSW